MEKRENDAALPFISRRSPVMGTRGMVACTQPLAAEVTQNRRVCQCRSTGGHVLLGGSCRPACFTGACVCARGISFLVQQTQLCHALCRRACECCSAVGPQLTLRWQLLPQ